MHRDRSTRYGLPVSSPSVVVRRARTSDVPAIKAIVDIYAGSGRHLLAKELVTLYEDVQDFRVAEFDGEVVGCGALHVLWADLGEVRTLAVHPEYRGRQIGAGVLGELVATARELGLTRLFALTFHTEFFARHGFVEIEGTPVDSDTYVALRQSYDPGVAEFLGLEYVKPNTLGNTRMLLNL
jgi:amino-acid N-acetyltransferase